MASFESIPAPFILYSCGFVFISIVISVAGIASSEFLLDPAGHIGPVKRWVVWLLIIGFFVVFEVFNILIIIYNVAGKEHYFILVVKTLISLPLVFLFYVIIELGVHFYSKE